MTILLAHKSTMSNVGTVTVNSNRYYWHDVKIKNMCVTMENAFASGSMDISAVLMQ